MWSRRAYIIIHTLSVDDQRHLRFGFDLCLLVRVTRKCNVLDMCMIQG